MIILCSDKKKAFETCGEIGRDKMCLIDVALSAENIMIAAWSNGIGSCPVGSFNPFGVSKIINLPTNIVPELLICLGFPRTIPKPPRRLFKEVVFFERYPA